MSTADIVQKLWNYCNVLCDNLSACLPVRSTQTGVHSQAGGMSCLPARCAQAGGVYVEQPTYLLFLKMADILSKTRDRRIII